MGKQYVDAITALRENCKLVLLHQLSRRLWWSLAGMSHQDALDAERELGLEGFVMSSHNIHDYIIKLADDDRDFEGRWSIVINSDPNGTALVLCENVNDAVYLRMLA